MHLVVRAKQIRGPYLIEVESSDIGLSPISCGFFSLQIEVLDLFADRNSIFPFFFVLLRPGKV